MLNLQMWLVGFESYLVQHVTARVISRYEVSATSTIQFGVPESCVLGSILFIMFIGVLSLKVVSESWTGKISTCTVHQQADDTRKFTARSGPVCHELSTGYLTCLDSVARWMSASRLQLNGVRVRCVSQCRRRQLTVRSKHPTAVVDVEQFPVLAMASRRLS